jgi:hypothetical protein
MFKVYLKRVRNKIKIGIKLGELTLDYDDKNEVQSFDAANEALTLLRNKEKQRVAERDTAVWREMCVIRL